MFNNYWSPLSKSNTQRTWSPVFGACMQVSQGPREREIPKGFSVTTVSKRSAEFESRQAWSCVFNCDDLLISIYFFIPWFQSVGNTTAELTAKEHKFWHHILSGSKNFYRYKMIRNHFDKLKQTLQKYLSIDSRGWAANKQTTVKLNGGMF